MILINAQLWSLDAHDPQDDWLENRPTILGLRARQTDICVLHKKHQATWHPFSC